jgi:hypothetical protein
MFVLSRFALLEDLYLSYRASRCLRTIFVLPRFALLEDLYLSYRASRCLRTCICPIALRAA